MTWKNTIRKSKIAKKEVKFSTGSRMYVGAEDYGNDNSVSAGFEGDIFLDWEFQTRGYNEVRLQINKLEFNGTLYLEHEDSSKNEQIVTSFEVDTRKIELELNVEVKPEPEALSFEVGVTDIEIDVDFVGGEDISDAEIKALIRFEHRS